MNAGLAHNRQAGVKVSVNIAGAPCRGHKSRSSAMVVSKPVRRLAVLALLIVGWADAAGAQDKPDNWLTRLFQPPASGSVPTPGGDTNDWSGQAGASATNSYLTV